MPLSASLPFGAVSILQGTQQAAEQLISKEDETSRDSSLQQAGWKALKESTRALLSHDLPYAVQETPVYPHLGKNGTRLKKEIQDSLLAKATEIPRLYHRKT